MIRHRLLTGRIAFDLLAVMGFGLFALEASGFRTLAATFPLLIGITGTVLATANLAIDIRRATRQSAKPLEADAHGTHQDHVLTGGYDTRAAVRQIAWFGLLVVLIYLIGMIPAAALFLVGFLTLESRADWRVTVVGTIVTCGGLALLARFLNFSLPSGVLLT